jgi:hypothetical protein
MKGIVFSNKAKTKGLAGLWPNTLSIPNQKKTRNKAVLARGLFKSRKKVISLLSIVVIGGMFI